MFAGWYGCCMVLLDTCLTYDHRARIRSDVPQPNLRSRLQSLVSKDFGNRPNGNSYGEMSAAWLVDFEGDKR